MARQRVAVLISGGGSNLQALIDAARADDAAFQIVHVISNVADAYGLVRAAEAGIPTSTIPHRGFPSRAEFDAALMAKLDEVGADLVCLAGFMRLLGTEAVTRWSGRMLNIHPSLLPAFTGLHTHQRALDTGVRVHGCTVHLVTPALDEGPIIVQGVVPVLADDDATTLAARVLEVEHQCYPLALELVASGRARLVDGRVRVEADAAVLVRHPLLESGG